MTSLELTELWAANSLARAPEDSYSFMPRSLRSSGRRSRRKAFQRCGFSSTSTGRPLSRVTDVLPCVILAGGLGTRMRPMTENIPKALVPVLGRPFAEWQLELLAQLGIRDVVYSIGYRGEQIRRALDGGARFGLEITYVDEGTELKGSGGALRYALDK